MFSQFTTKGNAKITPFAFFNISWKLAHFP
jgi:hypothetical protein